MLIAIKVAATLLVIMAAVKIRDLVELRLKRKLTLKGLWAGRVCTVLALAEIWQ